MKVVRNLICALFLMLSITQNLFAEEIHLKNGDKVSGDVVRESDYIIVVDTAAMGEVTIEKEFVKEPEKEPTKEEKASLWDKTLSLGYSLSRGNTEVSAFNGAVELHKKTEEDEINAKLTSLYTSDEKKLDEKKFYGLLRYAYSFGEEKDWYHFYKFEGDQDRSANINYRLIPATGIGYWLVDEENYKAMVEVAAGYQYTDYRDGTDSDSDAVIVPRGFYEKLLYKNLKFRQDLTLYPSLSSGGDFRLRSETSFINPISDKLAWKISLIDEFNSSPQGDTKKNDFRLISAIDLNF